MKHYVLENEPEFVAASTERRQYIDVIVASAAAKPSAQMIIDFFCALNELVEDFVYVVKVRVLAEEPIGGPRYWAGRTALFLGDIHMNWRLSGQRKAWVSQVISLSKRSIMVGGAVLVLGQYCRGKDTVAAVHPNFVAAAQEVGLVDTATGFHHADEGRTHSAISPLSALRLLSELVSRDHGQHLADTLREYIGLSEPTRFSTSQLATRLIRRSGADPVVRQAIEEMLQNVEEPLRISDLSKALGTSTRQLQRRFLAKTGEKLLATYRELRLERAHSLLLYSDLPQSEISAATGFSSVTAMGRAFRVCYRFSPDSVRGLRFTGELSQPSRLHASV
ncbi:MAG: helix-turn-helix domain-containing protein [Ruegeria sp.]